MNSIKALVFILIALAALLFMYSIVNAGLLTMHGQKDQLPFFANAAIVIAGVLSTNFGAVVGVSVVAPTAAIQPKRFLGLKPTVIGSGTGTQPAALANAAAVNPLPPNVSQMLQIIACWIYIMGLLTGFVFYLVAMSKGQKDDAIVPLITELSKTLLGVIVGVLGVALSR